MLCLLLINLRKENEKEFMVLERGRLNNAGAGLYQGEGRKEEKD